MKKIYITAFLLLIFSITLIFRVQFINNNSHCLDDNHIYMLTTMSVWDKEGVFYHKLSPVITFTNPGDKHVAFYKRLEDSNGDNYYVSYPPLLFILTYPIVEIFGFENGKVILQITNLILHLLSCFFIYLIVIYYFGESYKKLFFPAVFAFATYCFSPVLLYLHTDIYFPEMFSQVLLIVSVYFTLKILKNADQLNNFQYFLFGLLIFCFVYTEWIGTFFVFSVCLILFSKRKKKGYLKLLKTTILTTILSIMIVVLQYSSIAGFKNMVRSFLIRFIDRSGYFVGRFSESSDNIYNLDSYFFYLKNIFNGLWGVGLLFIVMTIILLFAKKSKFEFKRNMNNNLLIISTLPVAIYFIVFFNATMLHYHLVAKLMFPVAIGTGLVLNKLLFNETKINKIAATCFTLLFVLTSYFSLVHYSNYEKSMISCTNQEKNRKTAKFITENAKNDEVIFLNIKSENPEPIIYLGFLTSRNMVYSKSFVASKENFKRYPQKKAVYFEINENSGKYSLSRFEKE